LEVQTCLHQKRNICKACGNKFPVPKMQT